jgi:rfaE bifunctional protein nucleotidyltransferase chain/domain/rfaE bifunctional protein kinase chain/domain
MNNGPLVVVGDALLDRDLDGVVERLSPEGPVPVVDDPAEQARPGGAALAAALAAIGEREVVLVTALGGERGKVLAGLLEQAGVVVADLGLDGDTPEKVRIRAGGQTLLRLDQGGRAGAPGALTAEARHALDRAAAVLVADYGRGVAAAGDVRATLAGLPAGVPVVWDPHPRGPEPVPGVRLVTPNQAEAAGYLGHLAPGLPGIAAGARALLERWQAAAVAVTMGSSGALLAEGDAGPQLLPAPQVTGGDPCGAGDRFAATAAGLLAGGALPSEAVAGAVAAASAFVAAGGAAAFRPGRPAPPEPGPRPALLGVDAARRLVEEVHGRGGIAVATGGCFDLLHAGHVATLRAARALGECLIVCLNSDDSVRRLKGPGRPLVTAADRASVLAELGCVDAIVVFDEDTPEAVLDRFRPDVFAKGGDYTLSDLPEAELLAGWGGQAVVLPYLAGRSTTLLVKEARKHGQPIASGNGTTG